VGQSAALTSQRSLVQVQYRPPSCTIGGTVVGVCPINLKTKESGAYLYFVSLGQYDRVVAAPHEALKRYFT
jgi:hypothetical protein